MRRASDAKSVPGVLDNHSSPSSSPSSSPISSPESQTYQADRESSFEDDGAMFKMSGIPMVPVALRRVAQPQASKTPPIQVVVQDFSRLAVAATAPVATPASVPSLPQKILAAPRKHHQRQPSNSMPLQIFDFDEPELNGPIKPHTSPIPKV